MSSSLKRVYGFITTSDFKIKEVADLLMQYGISIVKINASEMDTFLQSGNVKYKIMGVFKEQTHLIKCDHTYIPLKEEYQNDNYEHLDIVKHISHLTLYYMHNNELQTKEYISEIKGYIDLLRRIKKNNNIYDWDDIFIIRQTNKSYLETPIKVCARSVIIMVIRRRIACNHMMQMVRLSNRD
jgi:hypothetical protein